MALDLCSGGSSKFSPAPFGIEPFPSPWHDASTLAMPTRHKDALAWAEYIYLSDGTYRMAMERVISYFLTSLEVSHRNRHETLGDDEQDRWLDVLDHVLCGLEGIQAIDRDEACYGNCFVSLLVPFVRMLQCGSHIYQLQEMAEQPQFRLTYDSSRNEFLAIDPSDGKSKAWQVVDMPGNYDRDLRLKLWSAHEIEISFDDYSGESEYLWRIPESYKREVRRNNWLVLAKAPQEVLKAVSEDGWYLFGRDELYHFRQPCPSGLGTRGWGIPRSMLNFRNLYHVQTLRRYNEGICADFIIPWRILFPGRTTADTHGDTLHLTNMGDFSSRVLQMQRQRRRDPARLHTMPYPVDQVTLGGEARALAPKDLLEQAYDVLLNSVGVPLDLYRGSLQVQAAPVALRLFEATHSGLVHGNNRFLLWLASRLGPLLKLPPARPRLRSVVHADDFQKQMLAMQMYMGQQVSGRSAFGNMGFDWKAEQRRIAEEASYQQRLQAELQEEMDQAAFGEQIAAGQAAVGAPPQGAGVPGQGAGAAAGMPAQGVGAGYTGYSTSPVAATTPQELWEEAEARAVELLGLPASQRNSELRMLKQKHPPMHGLVTEKLREHRQRASSAGKSMLLGEQPSAPMQ